MQAKLDENLPVETAELLRTAGWECDSVHDEGLAGADDPDVAAACQAGARVAASLSAVVQCQRTRITPATSSRMSTRWSCPVDQRISPTQVDRASGSTGPATADTKAVREVPHAGAAEPRQCLAL